VACSDSERLCGSCGRRRFRLLEDLNKRIIANALIHIGEGKRRIPIPSGAAIRMLSNHFPSSSEAFKLEQKKPQPKSGTFQGLRLLLKVASVRSSSHDDAVAFLRKRSDASNGL
jgi:hypothetical protein